MTPPPLSPPAHTLSLDLKTSRDFFRNSVPVVGDGDDDIFAIASCGNCYFWLGLVLGRVDCVLDQVDEDLAKLVVISKDMNRSGDIDEELD